MRKARNRVFAALAVEEPDVKMSFIIIAFMSAIVLFGLWYFIGIPMRINTTFATKAILDDEHGIVVVTDAKDVKAIGNLLDGWAIVTDSDSAISRPFVSITMSDGQRSAVFYPCYGEDRRIKVGDTEKYRHLSDKQKKTLDKVLKKCGLVIP